MDQETLKQSRMFYKWIIFQLIWLAKIYIKQTEVEL